MQPGSSDPNALANKVEHIFVLMLENRSLDHMLGFSSLKGKDAETGKETSIHGLAGNESNSYLGTPFKVTPGADISMPLDPLHEFPDVVIQLAGEKATYPPGGPYPPINNSGFVVSYVEAGGGKNPGEIMKCYTPAELPVLNALATNFAVCDSWYSSMPGPTWPNRFFAMAASAGGLDRSPSVEQMVEWESVLGFSFEHGSLFEALEANGRSWRIYRGDRGPLVGGIPIAGALKGIPIADSYRYSEFAADLHKNYSTHFTWIEPNYGSALDDTYKGGTSQHPVDSVTGGERLIKETYEAIRNSPLWEKSLLILTWDEHGGFYDHVPPAEAEKPGDKIVTPGEVNQFGFAFGHYGVRVPAVIVSPYIPAQLIDHRTYDHSSIPATVERVFGFGPLTNRDKIASDVRSLFLSETPEEKPTKLPNPAVSAVADAAAAPEPPSEAKLAEPVGHSNLAGFLHIAMRYELETSPPEQRPAILARVRAINTRAEALAYINDAAVKLDAADRPSM
ncbi:MAG TPA: alkaline phosphatase family protein [Solirubrobacteraceae bacterium]|jgi:phospholipase C